MPPPKVTVAAPVLVRLPRYGVPDHLRDRFQAVSPAAVASLLQAYGPGSTPYVLVRLYGGGEIATPGMVCDVLNVLQSAGAVVVEVGG